MTILKSKFIQSFRRGQPVVDPNRMRGTFLYPCGFGFAIRTVRASHRLAPTLFLASSNSLLETINTFLDLRILMEVVSSSIILEGFVVLFLSFIEVAKPIVNLPILGYQLDTLQKLPLRRIQVLSKELG